jgi:predicted small lipoprotein YifL
MKNAIITGIMAATILIAGCGKKSPSSSATPPPAQADATSSSPVAQPPERAIVTKAKSIVLPEFKLDGVTLKEAVKRLSVAARQNALDGKGVNFMIKNSDVAAAIPKITLALKNVTLEEATERLAKATGVSVSAEDYAFVFDPKSDKP